LLHLSAQDEEKTIRQTNDPTVNKGNQTQDAPYSRSAGPKHHGSRNHSNIQSAIAQDKSLSICAKNVKVITQDGIVNLRRPMRTKERKATIEQKAIDLAVLARSRMTLRFQLQNSDVRRPDGSHKQTESANLASKPPTLEKS
jgi:hypothetical protein